MISKKYIHVFDIQNFIFSRRGLLGFLLWNMESSVKRTHPSSHSPPHKLIRETEIQPLEMQMDDDTDEDMPCLEQEEHDPKDPDKGHEEVHMTVLQTSSLHKMQDCRPRSLFDRAQEIPEEARSRIDRLFTSHREKVFFHPKMKKKLEEIIDCARYIVKNDDIGRDMPFIEQECMISAMVDSELMKQPETKAHFFGNSDSERKLKRAKPESESEPIGPLNKYDIF